MDFGGFPKSEFEAVHALRGARGLFEFDQIHLFELFVKCSECANSLFVNHAFGCGDGASFGVDIL